MTGKGKGRGTDGVEDPDLAVENHAELVARRVPSHQLGLLSELGARARFADAPPEQVPHAQAAVTSDCECHSAFWVDRGVHNGTLQRR